MGLLYTGMKVFHFKDKIDSLPREVDRIEPPVHIRVKPTNACNHRCRYCAYREDDLQLGTDMNVADYIPRGKMLELVDDFAAMGVKAVTFSGGGEPFAYKYFAETLRRLAATDISFASLSNGALLTGEAADIFSESGTWLRVSMDGWDDESYIRYRGVGDGEYTKILNNMTAFARKGGQCYLGVNLVVDAENHSHVYEAVSRIKDTGAHSVKISPCIVDNAGAGNAEYHAPFFDATRDEIERVMANLSGDGFEVYDSYHELDTKFDKPYDWCPFQQILPIVGADQNIYSCQDKAYNLAEGCLGSIEDTSFKDFWFNGKDKFFKINPSKVCGHHCVANAKNHMVLDYLNVNREHLGFV